MSTPLPHIEGPWLAARNSDDGAPIPAQVAEKLVGQRFATFGDLRAAIWTLVANDPKLAPQFSTENNRLMQNGNAPYPPESEQVVVAGSGELSHRTWELHHEPAIKNGGPVYDLSTIRMVSPQQHDRLEKRSE